MSHELNERPGEAQTSQGATFRSLELVLTPRCNYRCSYCYQDRKQGLPMTWQVAKSALDALLRSERQVVKVAFSGGEPLLELELIRRAVGYIRQHRPDPSSVTFVTSTNGGLLDEEAIDFLVENDFEVQLSFDGVAGAQDSREAGSFESIDRLLGRLLKDHATWAQRRLNVNLTVTEGNLRYLGESVAYLLGTGVGEVSICAAFTHQGSWRPEDIQLMEAQFDRVLELSVEFERKTGRIPLAEFRPRAPRDEKDALCRVGQGNAVTVDCDGRIYGCVTFVPTFQTLPSALLKSELEPLSLGSMHGPDLEGRLRIYRERAAASPLINGWNRKRSSYDNCHECRYRPECSVCPSAIGHNPSNADPDHIPDFLCAFQRVTAACRERFPKQPDPFEMIRGKELPAEEQRILDFASAWVHQQQPSTRS